MAGASVLMQLKNKMQQLREDLEDYKDKLEAKEHELNQEKEKRAEVGVTHFGVCMTTAGYQ